MLIEEVITEHGVETHDKAEEEAYESELAANVEGV